MRKHFLVIFSLLIILFVECASVNKIQSHLKFGIIAAQKDLWDEAIFQWEKVLKLNPNSAEAHNNLAVAYERKGLFEKAKEEYEKALKLAPNDYRIKSNYESFLEIYKQLKKTKNDKKN
ncbi:tetratricopeptide repeat protein [SCandidatus Aminicenantes bacterium Aminicenantia_JdfR_composite]|jgi:Tfp pilus assembly protein PilF|nr:tetratricopeptide repeat protein [SCandidatus Aminicenantes bacterium Aminicenantia_JdfR_composite]MCP2597747.1 tetratricopeptide repeat protein [Candidatus Aminicenantes bacterium AC-335-L06]